MADQAAFGNTGMVPPDMNGLPRHHRQRVMPEGALPHGYAARQGWAAASMMTALVILALDVATPLQGAVAVLYPIVVLVAARDGRLAQLMVAALVSVLLATIGYALGHGGGPVRETAPRLLVSLLAIGITTLLSLRHQRAIAECRRSEGRYRTIYNAVGFPICESDWSGAYALLHAVDDPGPALIREASLAARVRNGNQAAANLLGFDKSEDLVGRNFVGRHSPQSEAAFQRFFKALKNGSTHIEEEVQLFGAGDEPVDVVLWATLPPDHDGWKHVFVMAHDVTERNRAQMRLTQAQSELAHMSRITMLGQLSASIAHEVNQPLSAIITYAKSGRRWLERDVPYVAEVRDCLERVAFNGKRAAEVIARIRNLARKSELKRDEINIADLIAETSALLEREMRGHAVALRLSIDPEIPPVHGDRVQIQQVLMNLMLNAEQAMEGIPSDQRELAIEAAWVENTVAITVRDQGPGFGGQDPEHVFAPFFTTKREGMGMGLSICRSIVEQHGGTLKASALPEGGAAFRFDIPLEHMGAPGLQAPC